MFIHHANRIRPLWLLMTTVPNLISLVAAGFHYVLICGFRSILLDWKNNSIKPQTISYLKLIQHPSTIFQLGFFLWQFRSNRNQSSLAFMSESPCFQLSIGIISCVRILKHSENSFYFIALGFQTVDNLTLKKWNIVEFIALAEISQIYHFFFVYFWKSKI